MYIVCGVLVAIVIVFLGQLLNPASGYEADEVATFFAWVSVIVGVIVQIRKTNFKSLVGQTVSHLGNVRDDISSAVGSADNEYYAIAEREVVEGTYDDGLWSRALVEAKGDESKRKIEYINLRVKQLRK